MSVEEGIRALNEQYTFTPQADGSLLAKTKIGVDAIRHISETTEGYNFTAILPALRNAGGGIRTTSRTAD